MADILILRQQLASEAAALDLAQKKLDELQLELDNAEGDLPPSALISSERKCGRRRSW